MDKKLMAKKEMLQMLADMMSDEMHPEVKDGLHSKKMEKVTVMAPDKKGLEKGLSKAQELMKARFGEDSLKEESPEAEYAEEPCEEGCPGCPMCEASEQEGE